MIGEITKALGIKVPITLLDDAEYAAASVRLDELRAELGQARARYDRMLDARSQPRSSLVEQAEAHIAGTAATELAVVDHGAQLERASRELRIVEKAVELQIASLRQLGADASKRICANIGAAPRYREIVLRLSQVLVAAAKVADEERDFREGLIAADIMFLGAFTPMPFRRLGALDDRDSFVNQWLRECVEFGFLTRAEAQRFSPEGFK